MSIHKKAALIGVEPETLANFLAPDRQFRLQSNEHYGWLCGKKGEQQALVSTLNLPTEIEVLWFDSNGRKISIEKISLPKKIQPTPNEVNPKVRRMVASMMSRLGHNIDSSKAKRTTDTPNQAQIELLLGHIGVAKATIEICELDEDAFYTSPLPSDFEEFLDDHKGEFFSDEDRIEYPKQMRKWIEDGCWILTCGNDYYMNKDGSVDSS